LDLVLSFASSLDFILNCVVAGCLVGNFFLLYSIFRWRTRGPRPRDEGSLAYIYALTDRPEKESNRQRRLRYKRGTRSLALLIRHVSDVHEALGLNAVARYEIVTDLLDAYSERPTLARLETYLVACYALDMPSDPRAAESALDSEKLQLVVMAAATMNRRMDDRVVALLIELKLRLGSSLEGAMEVLRRRSPDGMSAAVLFHLLQIDSPTKLLNLSPLVRLLNPLDRRMFMAGNEHASSLRVAAAILREGNEVNDIWFVRENWARLDEIAKIAYIDRMSFNPLLGKDVADLLSEAVTDMNYEVRIAAGRALKRGFRNHAIAAEDLDLKDDAYAQEMVDYALDGLQEDMPWTLASAA
jgi:hypothetical protein